MEGWREEGAKNQTHKPLIITLFEFITKLAVQLRLLMEIKNFLDVCEKLQYKNTQNSWAKKDVCNQLIVRSGMQVESKIFLSPNRIS